MSGAGTMSRTDAVLHSVGRSLPRMLLVAALAACGPPYVPPAPAPAAEPGPAPAPPVLAPDEMLPAPGQGALALQCRKDDPRTCELLKGLNDPDTEACVAAERALVVALQGDCHSPIAALARVTGKGKRLTLSAAVGARDGSPPVIRATADEPLGSSQAAVKFVVDVLVKQGVRKLLEG